MEFFTKEYYTDLYNKYKLRINLGLFIIIAILIFWMASLVGGFSNFAYIFISIAVIAFAIYVWRTKIWQRARISIKKWWKGEFVPDYKKEGMKEKSKYKYYKSLIWYKYIRTPLVIFLLLFVIWWLRPFYHQIFVDLTMNLSNGIVLFNFLIIAISMGYIIYKILHRKKNSQPIQFLKLIIVPVLLSIVSTGITFYTIKTGSVNALALNKLYKKLEFKDIDKEPKPILNTLMSEEIATFAAEAFRGRNTINTEADKSYNEGKIIFLASYMPKSTITRFFNGTSGIIVINDNLNLEKSVKPIKKHKTIESERGILSKNIHSSISRKFSITEFPLSSIRNVIRILYKGKMYMLVQIDKLSFSDFPNMYPKSYGVYIIPEDGGEYNIVDSLNLSLFGSKGYFVSVEDFSNEPILKNQIVVSKEYINMISDSAAYSGGIIDRTVTHKKELSVDSINGKKLITNQYFSKIGDDTFDSPKPFATIHFVSRQDNNVVKSKVHEIWYVALDGSNIVYKFNTEKNKRLIAAPSSYAQEILKGDSGKSYNNDQYAITKLVAINTDSGRFIVSTISAIDEHKNINSLSTVPVVITPEGKRVVIKGDIPLDEQLAELSELSQ